MRRMWELGSAGAHKPLIELRDPNMRPVLTNQGLDVHPIGPVRAEYVVALQVDQSGATCQERRNVRIRLLVERQIKIGLAGERGGNRDFEPGSAVPGNRQPISATSEELHSLH